MSENDLDCKSQRIASEEFFCFAVFGTAADKEDLRSAVWADYLTTFYTVNELEQEEKNQTSSGNIKEDQILMVAPEGKENQTGDQDNHPQHHK